MLVRIAFMLFACSFTAVASHAQENAIETRPREPLVLTAAQVARGQAIQQLLVRGIDFARERGDWPQDLAELKVEPLPQVRYLGAPAKLDTTDRNVRSRLRAISPVCHETFEKFPDGVWVGYADGHIELVRNAPALQTALAQFKAAGALVEKYAVVEHIERQPAQKPDARMLLKITDAANKPVAGAEVGQYLWNSDHDVKGSRGKLATLSEGQARFSENVTDAEGRVEILYEWFFYPADEPFVPQSLIVQHKDRGLMAVVSLEAKAFAQTDDGKVPSLEVKLHPATAVKGSLSRLAAPAASGDAAFTNVAVYTLQSCQMPPFASMSKSGQFNFLLPPGDYLLHAYGEHSFNTDRYVHIDAGAPTIKLEIDLPADFFTSIVGKPAPEIRGIKAWQNGKDTTLEKLRGKWVLVDFWGYWCPACIEAMPELMKLHDDFGEKGLAIVAVHDDSVESIAEMQTNLEGVKLRLWKGRELPFFVALDGGGELPIAGTDRRVKGATHAAYGVQSWPTTVLVDPDGKVVGAVDAREPELRKLLEEKLKPGKESGS